MDQINQESGSPPATDLPMKRKRGRPRKDEGPHQEEKSPINPIPETMSTSDDMIGQVVSGVIEGSFDAGYFLSVSVKDTDKELRGVVFIPDKVSPVTEENDVAPHATMYGREEIDIPSLDPQTQAQGRIVIQNQSASCMASFPHHQPMKDTGIGPQLQSTNTATDMNWSGSNQPDMQIKDTGDAFSGEKVPSVQIPECVPVNHTLPLMPRAHRDSDDFTKQHDAVELHEASSVKNTLNTDRLAPKDSVIVATPFVDFFPHHETTQLRATGSGSNPDLALFRDETKLSGTERQKSPARAEPHGFNLLTEKTDTPMENVPEELLLELGNKATSGANMGPNALEANPKPAASKSSFLANLFKGEAAAAKPEAAAASDSGFPMAPEADNVDCNMEEAMPLEQS